MLFCVLTHSQDLPEIIPPSPTAFELAKYGDIPINESTGMANINIPFFNYSLGEINVGISLDYATSGIKVDQVASWVGMGWNLNVGGVITRTVRGNADELYTQKYNNSFLGIQSLYNQNNSYYYSFLAEVNDAKDRSNDYEPDIYNFNVGGFSGTFILDESSKPLLLKRDNQSKIEKVTNGFQITTTNGLVYLFTDKEYNSVRSTCQKGGASLAEKVVSAWYLTKITALNGDEVLFHYTDNNFIYASGYNSSYGNIYNIMGPTSCEGASVPESPGIENCVLYSYLKNKKITSITNNRNNHKIIFSNSANRIDLPDPALKLDKVSLYKGTSLIKAYELNYQTVTSVHNTGNILLTSNEYKKRLFLKDVLELSKEDSNIGGKKYAFEYNQPNDLPPRFSFAQDLLGFYNGKNGNPSLLPKTDTPNGTSIRYSHGNRSSNFTSASRGLLTKVIYPTKGTTTLEFEPDAEIITDYSYQQSNFNLAANSETNNINILQITNLFNQKIRIRSDVNVLDDGQDNVHNRMLYSVKDVTTNQIILDENMSLGTQYKEIYLIEDHVYEFKVDLSPVREDNVDGSISFIYSSDVSENQQKDKTGIRIKRVIKKANESAPQEIKRYYYNNIANYKEEPILSTKQYFFSELLNKEKKCTPVSGGLYSLQYQLYTVTSGGWNPIYKLTNRLNKYEFVTVSYGGDNFENGGTEKQFSKTYNSLNFEFGREQILNATTSNESLFNGTLIRETNYQKHENSLQKVTSVEYDYEIDASKTRSINGYIGRNESPEFPFDSYNINVAELSHLQLNHYYVHSMFNKLKGQKTINYFKGAISSEINEKFYYKGYNHLFLTKKEVTNSSEEVLKTEMKYAQDLGNSTLINEHRIATPIETKTYRNDDKLSTQNTKYDTFGNLYLPEKIQTSKGDTLLEDRVIYHSYDNKGNPVEVSKKDGTHIVYIWGYNNTQPIAKIENATFSKVQSAILSISDSKFNTLAKIQALSNADNDRTIDTHIQNVGVFSSSSYFAGNEGKLREALNSLRNKLKKAQVTSFTYDPLVGVTSVTDPRGQTIYYHYDSFNRLEHVKDSEGNILSKNEYNYKN